MEKYFEEWDGKKFPVREVMFEVCYGMETVVKVADLSLRNAIVYAYDHESHVRHSEAVDLDRQIYYYCDYGFIESDPTDEEIVDYLIKNGC